VSTAASDALSAPDGLPTPRRYWAIAAILLSIVVAVLDSSIANVALPTIARDLRANAADAIWVVNAYQIAVVMLLLPLAALGEIIGYRRVSQVGLAVFTLASIACACSNSLFELTLARVLQGVGAGGILSVTSALVRFTYPQRMLGRALGVNAIVVSISAALGPTIASGLLALGDWRWLFGVNVPIGALAVVMAAFNLPESPKHARRFNLVGAGLTSASFGLLITGLQAFAHGGAGQAFGGLELALAALATWALIGHERKLEHPILPFDLLRTPIFALSVATSISSFAAQMLALVALPFALVRLGHSPVEIGLLLTPWPLAVGVAAPIAGRLADKYPAGVLGGLGLATLAVGLGALATISAQHESLDIVWRMALCGLGFGFFQAPNNRALLATAPRQRSGAAGGVLGTARVLGQSLGAALAALLFQALGDAAPPVALWLAAAIAIAAAGVSMLRLTRRGERLPAAITSTGFHAGPD
jgi:DHA2 family multidrug resistance protein-like MFS transporter